MAFFISFGNDLIFYMILFGVVWIAFVVIQIGTGFLSIRSALRRQFLRAVVWGGACFALVAAQPLYRVSQIRQAEAVMNAASIQSDLPDFSGKAVLYVPSRTLDDITFACLDLVRMSGADTIYLADPWRDSYQNEQAAPDISAPIDLIARIRGRAVIDTTKFDFPTCQLEPIAAPQQLDYILVENDYGDLKPAFDSHLIAHNAWEDLTRLRFFVAPVEDAHAFFFGPDAAVLALFTTYRPGFNFPYSPLNDPMSVEVPRQYNTLPKVVRQIACREPAGAKEAICAPFM